MESKDEEDGDKSQKSTDKKRDLAIEKQRQGLNTSGQSGRMSKGSINSLSRAEGDPLADTLNESKLASRLESQFKDIPADGQASKTDAAPPEDDVVSNSSACLLQA